MGPLQRIITEHMDFPLVRLPIKSLDLDEGPHCTSFGAGSDLLRESILRVGIVNPPLVHKDRLGVWQVVAGFRRLRVLRDLDYSTCSFRDLSVAALTPLDLLLLGLSDNLATRRLNEVERAMALSRISTLVHRDYLLEKFMPLLGLPSRPDLLDSYLALETSETPVKQAVGEGRLTMRSFQDMELWRPEDRISAINCISNLKININKQLQFIDILSDIMTTENSSAESVLNSEPFSAILSQAGKNAPQAGNRLLNSLRRRRFPSLDSAERSFKGRVKRLGLPQGVRIIHSPYFEEDLFRLEITFKSGHELHDCISLLSEIQGLEFLGPPWETENE